jgi:hypothetical protein
MPYGLLAIVGSIERLGYRENGNAKPSGSMCIELNDEVFFQTVSHPMARSSGVTEHVTCIFPRLELSLSRSYRHESYAGAFDTLRPVPTQSLSGASEY